MAFKLKRSFLDAFDDIVPSNSTHGNGDHEDDDDFDFLDALEEALEEPTLPKDASGESCVPENGLPTWHRPGPGRGHKNPKPASSQRGKQGQAAKMTRAHMQKRLHQHRDNVVAVVAEATNRALGKVSHLGKVRLVRARGGALDVVGQPGLQNSAATGSKGKFKRKLAACTAPLKQKKQRRTADTTVLAGIAFEGIQQVSAQASAWKKSRYGIREAHKFVAHVASRLEHHQMEAIVASLQEHRPDWVAVHKMWDETGERVITPHLARVSEVWHVMVVKMSIAWGWFSSGQTGGFELTPPPVAITNTGSDAIYAAFRSHPALKDYFSFCDRVLGLAKELPFDLSGIDDAPSNGRLLAHELNVMADVLSESAICRNHANHLIQGMLIGAVFGLRFLTNMFAGALFCRMGSHFTRMGITVPRFVREAMQPRLFGPPPLRDELFAEEMVDFLIRAKGHHDEEDGVHFGRN